MLVLALIWLPHKCTPVMVWISSWLNCSAFLNSYLHRTSSISLLWLCLSRLGDRVGTREGAVWVGAGDKKLCHSCWTAKGGAQVRGEGADWLVNYKSGPSWSSPRIRCWELTYVSWENKSKKPKGMQGNGLRVLGKCQCWEWGERHAGPIKRATGREGTQEWPMMVPVNYVNSNQNSCQGSLS